MSKRIAYIDIESHDANLLFDMDPDDFFRLGQYAINDGPILTTTSRQEMLDVIRSADIVVGHNIHAFDLTALFGQDSMEPLHMALEKRVFCTFVHANLVYPNPGVFTLRPKAEDKPGRKVFGDKPEFTKLWLSLDNLCYQLGLEGKIGDLKAMAKEFGGFGNIPVDHPEFVEYAEQDIVATRSLAKKLMQMSVPFIHYYWREQLIAAINAQATRNGIRIDTAVATARVEELKAKRDEIMAWLVDKYDFPTDGKSPWASAKGKEVIFQALADYGITPDTNPDWEKTATGNPSLGGQALIDLTAGTEAEDLGKAIAELKGQRSLAQLALDSTHRDGRAHPEISSLQRSGRFSVTKPGLTVWTARGDNAVEKRYFVADEGEKMVEMDFSSADARVVAAVSGDIKFAERFAPGAPKAAEINGRLVFGDETYDSDVTHYYAVAKALGHAWAYRAGPKKLALTSGQPLEVAQQFVTEMNRAFRYVVKWQERVTDEGESGFVTNDWGRRMVVQDGRSYNQSPALIGQSSTRELLSDGLIRIASANPEVLRWFKFSVHDAVVWSIPETELDWAVDWIQEKMESTFHPDDPRAQAVTFPMEAGTPAHNWYEAGH